MGNRLGHSKEARKPKEDKRSEEDAQKGRKQKEKQKKQLGHKVVDPEAYFDESSHVTGGDSESCVFHSAENISFSPYLDSSTRSEHEQGTSWSEVLQQAALGAQHPYVLSSKDFQDGFSLEACIPSEIARLEEYNDGSSTTKSRYGHRSPSLNSSTVSKSSTDPKATFSGSHSRASGNHGVNTPAISSTEAVTTVKLKVPSSPTSTPIQKSTPTEWQEKQPVSPTSGLHHPHFYNHNRTYQQPSPLPVIKPTSPQPQRKMLLPKTSTPSKSATSESPSPSPSTPGPQRRAANFLALFRSSSKRGMAAGINEEGSKTDSTSDETRGRSYSTSNDSDIKAKSKPTWKTWERPRSKKSKKPIKDSIFGTSRKSDTKPGKDYTQDNTEAVNKEELTGASVAAAGNLLDTGTSTREKKIQNRATYVVQTTQKQSQMSAGSTHFEVKSNKEMVSSVESGQGIHSHSPPLPSRAAVCIMKLEELERSIEKTIREKFPDAEPFLIQKRSKEELHGSRSLPTTPANKKKLHLVRDEGTQLVNTKLHKDMTRYYNETYESPPSPSASPIVLRRFGARTRHASISPKTQRAKTAALFNSPSEMSAFGASRTGQSTAGQDPFYHRLSSDQATNPENLKMFSVAQKSESKYDNVMGDEETVTPVVNSNNYYPHRYETLKDKNREEITETSIIDDNSKNGREQSKVIIPTFSAVFGSVSPKLRRHLQVKFDEINDNIDDDKTQTDEDVQLANQNNKHETNSKAMEGSQNGENEVTGTGPSLECLESSHMVPGLINLKEKTHQERIPQFAGQPEVNEERKKAPTHKERNTVPETIGTEPLAARTGGINSSQSGLRAPRRTGAEAGYDHNTELGVITPLHLTGKPASEAEQGNIVSFEHRKTSACAVSSHISQSGTKLTAKSGQLSSSATKRTHSTDRVLLFESVVLSPPDSSAPTSPLSQPSPKQKSTCLEKNSDIAQAQKTTPNQLHAYSCASNENTVDNLHGEAPHSEPISSSSLTSARDISLSDTVTFSRETRGDLSQEGVTGDVSLQKCAFVSIIRADDERSIEISCSESDSVIFDKHDESNDSKGCFSSLASQKAVHVFCDSGTNGNILEEQQVSGTQRKDRAQVFKDEDRVLRQPVSEVISQMISRSNLQKQQHEKHRQEQQQKQQQQQQQQQKQQQQHLRSNITSPDHTVIQPQLATIQKYEQLSEVLEKRCVRIPADSTAVNINELRQSRCQEIQTDCYTTADKGVDSHGLIDTTQNSGISKIDETVNSLVSKERPDMEAKKDEQPNVCSEKEFVKISSDGSEKCERELAGESRISEHVPPPSPTALQQLLEEFEEQDDDIADEEEAMATMSREQLEIKEFSDTIYKRLSELLGSNAEDDKDVDSNNVSGSEEPQDLAEEKEGSSTSESSPEITACRSSDSTTRTDTCASIQTGFPVSPLVKILTVETSSSLTTTTSSESDIDDTPLMFHSFQNDENNDNGMFKNNDNYAQRQDEDGDLVFPEFDATNLVESCDPDRKPVSREYHSDDDVAKGRGIPDYYDDRPLWSRRQKPPGQLSAAMMAIRWRERRERWLKKRRRNRTDLISTGSSDTGSEYCLNRHNEPADVNYSENAYDDESTQRTNDMGSGILTSPKYTKPILPFFGSQAKGVEAETPSHFHSSVHRRKRQDGRWSSQRSGVSTQQATNTTQDTDKDRKYADTNIENKDKENSNEVHSQNSAGVKSGIDAPSIEDTFQELMSVQTILKEMQECKHSTDDSEKQGLLPLTTENVRSIREYYKDFYTSGNGRRSRMSATDRTESDLDLYSEIQDDASSESELYADDEGDDDGQEPYATAEDEAGATGRGSNTSCRSSKRDEVRHSKDEDDDSETSLVLSCTFYNSKTHEQNLIDTTELGPTAIYSYEPKTTHRSISAPQAPTSHTNLNSDDEFWTGSASIDESYKQLETAADAVSTTFQNAREQMHDIQYHLQALRRQMEVMQSDLSNVSMSLSQSTSTEYLKK